MITQIRLKDIIDEMEIQSEFHSTYLNKKTGEIVMASEEHFHAAENGNDLGDYAEWEQNAIKQAGEILISEDYISLPSKFDIHEYSIMEKFCLSLHDDELKNTMYYSIKGKGAFGRFKNNIFRYGIEKKWYEYQIEAFREIAIDWCEENHLLYSEE